MDESLKQAWTPEYVAGLMARSPLESREASILRGYGVVSYAHNAALAAEREKRPTLRWEHGNAEDQLLAAQAAIERHNELNWNTCDVIEFDLSLLHAHDEQVRKPLVEALEQIAENDTIGSFEACNLAADALAKVKP